MQFIIMLLLALAIPASIHAQDLFPKELLPTIAVDPEHLLKGGEYQLELSPLEETSTQTAPKIIDTMTHKEREQFNAQGFIIKQKEGELTLSLSSARMSLGSIAGAGLHKGQVEINISSNKPTSYSLLTAQEMQEDSNWNFPPTFCDGGQETCTVQKAALWENAKVYGFGYTLAGADAQGDFENKYFFRSFRVAYPLTIAGNEQIKGMRSLNMGIQLNTSPSTNEAIYGTIVKIIALSK